MDVLACFEIIMSSILPLLSVQMKALTTTALRNPMFSLLGFFFVSNIFNNFEILLQRIKYKKERHTTS